MNAEQETRLGYLLNGYANKSLGSNEESELFALLNNTENIEVEEILNEILEQTEPEINAERRERILNAVRSEMSEVREIPRYARNDKKVVAMWKRWTIAASVVGLLLVAGYWFFERTPRQARGDKEQIAVVHDVPAPTIARATLKLADGQIVYLDSVGNGQLAMQGNVSVMKSADGQILYNEIASTPSRNDEIKYNTVYNPRGSKVQALTLADGTQVWLNAESSITYPTAFVGNERKVTITGEAYFEVNPHPLKGSEKVPFFVEANGTTTQVLGTHFNVNAYSDEDAVRVTLLEGSVRLTQNTQSKMLEPGEQGIADPSVPSSGSGLRVTKDVNVEQVMAWKNGYFQMDGTDLGALMRQIARWYDVEISYEGQIPQKSFGGSLNRDVNLSDMLKALQQYGVYARLENRKVIVKQ